VVVDLLEAVEIDHRQRDLFIALGKAKDVLVQRVAIGQAGQQIGVGARLKPADIGNPATAKEEQRGGVDQDRGNQQPAGRADKNVKKKRKLFLGPKPAYPTLFVLPLNVHVLVEEY